MDKLKAFIRKVIPVGILIILALTSAGSAGENGQKWQLLFHYNQEKLELVEALPIAPTLKAIRTPGLTGAPMKLNYAVSWLDGQGKSLAQAETVVPLGMRVILTEDQPCREFVPDSGYVVVRTDGPLASAAPAALKMERRTQTVYTALGLTAPPPFSEASVILSIPRSAVSASLAGPVGFEKIRDTGPDDNRVVVVILGDGYTTTELTAGEFSADADALETAFYAKAPWDDLFNATNIYRVDIESNESGADNVVYGVYKDTYLNSSFWVNDIERLLALTGTGFSRAQAAANSAVGAGLWDVLLVLVNSTKYGGSGGSVAVSSVHASASEIVLHEMGHSFAFLADEYETAYPGYPAGDQEPNVDYDYFGSALKWINWVEVGTPLPTPENSGYDNAVGAFEGARYITSGIYRPWEDCLMRSLGRPFCPVCKEAIAMNFAYDVSFADNLDPYAGTTVPIATTGTTFTASSLPLSDLAFEWLLDAVPIDGETGAQLTLTAEQLIESSQTLTLRITYDTPLIRKTTIFDSYSWTVEPSPASCCVGRIGNANGSAEDEPTLGDISAIIDHLFISGAELPCYAEADANLSGAPNPTSDDISLGDISVLVDYLFITGTPLQNCP